MSLDKFIRLADFMVEFESDLTKKVIPINSKHSVAIHRDELKSAWDKAKKAYEQHILDYEATKMLEQASEKSEGDTKVEKEPKKSEKKKVDNQVESVKLKYKSTYAAYCRCLIFLGDIEDKFAASTSSTSSSFSSSKISNSFKLPACDTPVFHGVYLSWPTFRDSFDATFIKSTPQIIAFASTDKTRCF